MTEIFIIILVAIIILLCLLLKLVIVKRRVIVTIVKNLPIGIFRDKNKSYEIENKVYVKEISKDDIKENTISDVERNEVSECTNEGKGESSEVINNDNDNIIENNISENTNLVYWTPNGKTYHMSTSCFALSRSKVINQGTIEESEKSTLCDLCKDNL